MRHITRGIIIREKAIFESDKVLEILTESFGVVTAFAKGAKKPKSKLRSGTALFTYGEFSLYPTRDTYNLDESAPVELFFNLRSDFEKLVLAQYFCEIFLWFAPEREHAPEHFELMTRATHAVNKGEVSHEVLKAAVELRLLSLSGYMPAVGCCAGCEGESVYKFSVSDGVCYCRNCGVGKDGIALDGGTLQALRHVLHNDLKKIFAFNLGEKSLKQLGQIAEELLLASAGRGFKSLEFIKATSF